MGSRRILREIAVFGGWMQRPLTPAQEDRLLTYLKNRIKIEAKREDTIKISYYDTNPQRAFQVTNKLGEIFIREASESKEKQSRDAFEFMEGRVKEYAQKLEESQEKLLAHYRRTEGARAAGLPPPPPTADEEGEGTTPASRRTKIAPEALAALRAEEATLRVQLEGKRGANSAAETRQMEDQARARVSQLQTELDRLRGRFTDQHPEVVRAQHELASAIEDLARADKARAGRDQAVAAAAAIDDNVTRAARERLAIVQQQISAATGVPIRRRAPTVRAAAVSANPTASELEMRNVGQDTVLSELVRRYEANRDVYQDLLKRRENARVSMDLDSERRGLVLHVQEAAELPVVSSSVRLLYVAMGGLFLAIALPIVLLLAYIKLDPRVRAPRQIERVAHLPLLVAIPSGAAPRDLRERRTRWYLAASIVAGVVVIYAAALLVKMQSS
jgi:uncharacterized protein involved in exopolysaccharide biosynthesis